MITRRPASISLPGPRPMPLLGWRGNLLAYAREPIAYTARLFERYGDIAALQHGAHQLVFVLGAAHNRALLEQPDVFASTFGLHSAVGNAALKQRLWDVLECDGGAWQSSYRRIVAQTTRHACERWGVGQQLDAAWAMQRLSITIAARAMWGLQRDEDIAALLHIAGEWHAGSAAKMALGASIELPGTPLHSLRGLALRVEQLLTTLYAAARLRGEEQYTPDSLIALLTVDAPQREAITLLARLFAAGFASTAAALTWTLFLLTQHGAAQAELHAEARIAAVGDEASEQQLAGLKQLDRVIREGLRLFPPCAFGMRTAQQPATLGGYTLPNGTMVVYSPYLTHRLPERFFWPHRFRPERWLHIEPAPGEYLPFGAAPRTMLGTRNAELEIRIVLAIVLSRFVFGLAPGARIDSTIQLALLPRNGLPVLISPPDRPVRRREPHGDVVKMVEL